VNEQILRLLSLKAGSKHGRPQRDCRRVPNSGFRIACVGLRWKDSSDYLVFSHMLTGNSDNGLVCGLWDLLLKAVNDIVDIPCFQKRKPEVQKG